MSKQEEIIELTAEWLEEYFPKHNITDSGWLIKPEIAKELYRQDAGQFLSRLHSQGVVIKVDRELPENPYSSSGMMKSYQYSGYEEAQKDMAGYVAVEPLIREVTNE